MTAKHLKYALLIITGLVCVATATYMTVKGIPIKDVPSLLWMALGMALFVSLFVIRDGEGSGRAGK